MLFVVRLRSGDRPLLIIGLASTRNALYWKFNRFPGIRPCPLYTPPVALTDGLFCESEGLRCLFFAGAGKLRRTAGSKGKRSRNKASVGEPADGSFRFFLFLSLAFVSSFHFFLTALVTTTRL